jgi:hypothetical protein
VVYAPTITRQPLVYKIVVHAKNGSAHALFETYFYSSGAGVTHFSNASGATASAWGTGINVGAIDDDPWITESPAHGTTVYFRRGTQIVETSLPLTANPVLAVKPMNNVSFASAPAATGDRGFDMGTHVVVARTTDNQIWFVDSNQDTSLEP